MPLNKKLKTNRFYYPQIPMCEPSPKGAMTTLGGACGAMVIVVENGHGDTSLNPGRD